MSYSAAVTVALFIANMVLFREICGHFGIAYASDIAVRRRNLQAQWYSKDGCRRHSGIACKAADADSCNVLNVADKVVVCIMLATWFFCE